jgi:nitrogen fixation protein NifU and related proteins
MNDDLRDLYQEVILDHGRHPRNFRHPGTANRTARGDNPLCGDKVTVSLEVGADGIIRDAAFEGRGCAISTASASLMTETLKGKTEDEARILFHALHDMCTGHEASAEAAADSDDLDRLRVLSGVRNFPMRVKCATLAWQAVLAALTGETKATTE